MSTSVSAEDSSIFSTAGGNPFYQLGKFNWDRGEGPARSLPASLRALQVGSTWIVEFMRISASGLATKNHITSRVLLVRPYVAMNGARYQAARISMELPEKLFDVIDNEKPGSYFHQDLESGHDYYPGCFTVKLLKYSTPSKRCLQSRTFGFHHPLSLGELVDVVLNESMDEYVFLPYESQWRGCRDFMLQMWAKLVRQNKLRELSEDYRTRLSEDIGYTYYPDGTEPTYAAVKKGRWVHWERFIGRELEEGELEEDELKKYDLVPLGVYHEDD